MADQTIPMIETARQFLRCDPVAGKLFWLPRPAWAIPCDRVRSSVNSRIIGQEAGRLSHGYLHVRIAVGGKSVVSDYAHRLIWAMTFGEVPNGYIDHINGDRLDNRIINLRCATHSQNMMNRRGNKASSSRYCGVGWHEARKKWRAYIRVPTSGGSSRGRMVSLGSYDDENLAARAYNAAAQKYHGEFARLNDV